MELLTNAILHLPEYRTVSDAVRFGWVPGCVTGVAGVHKAHLISALCEEHGGRALVLTGDEAEAQRLCEDLTALGLCALFYPYREFAFRDVESASREYEHQRLGVLMSLLSGTCDVVVSCVDAALQFTMPPAELKKRFVTVRPGERVSMEQLEGALLSACLLYTSRCV